MTRATDTTNELSDTSGTGQGIYRQRNVKKIERINILNLFISLDISVGDQSYAVVNLDCKNY